MVTYTHWMRRRRGGGGGGGGGRSREDGGALGSMCASALYALHRLCSLVAVSLVGRASLFLARWSTICTREPLCANVLHTLSSCVCDVCCIVFSLVSRPNVCCCCCRCLVSCLAGDAVWRCVLLLLASATRCKPTHSHIATVHKFPYSECKLRFGRSSTLPKRSQWRKRRCQLLSSYMCIYRI